MAVTTLTGTTWFINGNPSIINNWEVQVSFTSSESGLLYSYFIATTDYYNGALVYTPETTSSVIAYRKDTSSWNNEAYRTVTFTSEVIEESGYLTQTEFISWLEANATLVQNVIDRVRLPDGDDYLFKDTVSGYLSSNDLAAGNNITITENSEGQTVISSSGGGTSMSVTDHTLYFSNSGS